MKKLILYIIKTINLLSAFALVLSYLAAVVNPNSVWHFELLGIAYPYLLISNLLFFIYWTYQKKRWLLLSLFAILIGYSHIATHFQFASNKTEEKGIKVVSYNVKYFSHQKEYIDSIVNFINNQQPDIVCLQEAVVQKTGIFGSRNIKKRIKGMAHYQLAHTASSTGPLTFTRYPIIDMGEIRFEKSGNIVIYSDLKIDNDTVRVYNCHLQSYKIRPRDYEFVDSLSLSPQSHRQWHKIKDFGWKLKKAMKKRAEQADILRKHIDNSPFQVIVCGDFNAPPMSYVYTEVGKNLNDAFVQSGTTTGNTFEGRFMWFRIDYILHSNLFEAYNFKRYKVGYSDHYPIVTKLIRK